VGRVWWRCAGQARRAKSTPRLPGPATSKEHRVDSKVTAVLDIYHARMAEERETRHQATLAGQKDALRDSFMLAVGPDTGQLINILARSLEAPQILELGTSYGYSTLWLAEAARATGGRLTTMELHDHKSAHAREMADRAGLAAHVDFQVGDAVELIRALPGGIDFVLVDLWKEYYLPCLEAFYPKLHPGAIIVADNIIKPGKEGALRYAEAVRAKPEMSSILVPVGAGLEISRFKAGSRR
jgi:predicted O-methyltransferase YrrM